MSWGPRPQVGQEEEVTVASVPLRVVPGTYEVTEAERFGDKISTGALRYQDFNPFENAHAVSSFLGGYGLRRYTDVETPEEVINAYRNADGVDCSRGVAMLAPEYTTETTGLAAPAVWQGEFVPSAGAFLGQGKYVAVGGTKVVYRNSDGTWSDTGITLPASARKGAVGVFGGSLVIGFGSSAAGVYTGDLASIANATTASPTSAPVYIFAVTADQASLYGAGGPASTDNWRVTAGLSPTSLDNVLTPCGAQGNDVITALSPGGGAGLVFVGRTDELGYIDFNGVYRSLVPFDTKLSTNNQGLRWYMGSGGEEQRGSVAVVFPRDRSLWIYTPSGSNSGIAENISVWAKHGFRPDTVKGRTAAIQGSARWLWHTIIDGAGTSYLLKRDTQSGSTHPQTNLGVAASDSLGITSLFGTNPLLLVGKGNDIASVILPLDGESPLDDSACRFQATGTLDMPDIDLGFPDEAKIPFTIRVVADNLLPGARSIGVWASLDGAAHTLLGTISNSPSGEVEFPTSTSARRIGLRFVLTTTDSAQTPVLLGFSLRCSLNAKLYRIWTFQARVPGTRHVHGGDDNRNAKTLIDGFWLARKDGIPVQFRDRWGDNWIVRLLKFGEKEILRDGHDVPETAVTMALLEVEAGEGNAVWNDPLFTWDASTSIWGPGA